MRRLSNILSSLEIKCELNSIQRNLTQNTKVPTLNTTILFSFLLFEFIPYIALLFTPLLFTQLLFIPLHYFTMNQQDFLMPAEGIQIDSSFSFKPIDHLGASGSDNFGGEPGSPTAIFRDAAEGLHRHYNYNNSSSNSNNDPMSTSPLQLALANPIYERRGSGVDVDAHQADAVQASRVISPYLFLHATQGELEERQQLNGEAMTWSGMPTEEIIDASTTEEHHHQHQLQQESIPRIDYSSFFQSVANANVNVNASAAGIMDCDDFSISSHEAESIDDDFLCFEKISGDAFWEEGMDQASSGPKRVRIPSQDSSSSNGSVRPTLASLGKVPRRRPIQPSTP
jgi:hypothetical protein